MVKKKKAVKKPAKKPAKKIAKKVKTVKKVECKKMATTSLKKTMTKAEMLSYIAEGTCLTRKEVGKVIDALALVIKRHVGKGAVGSFVLPGLVKFKVTRRPATKARKGVNPFTGEMITFKAKPARNVVKIRALKALKDMVK